MAEFPGSRSPGVKPARILVVDDNEDVRQMMAVALQTQGYTVEEAADAGEALDHLQSGRFDVVLSDYELPDQTGVTMLREATRSGLLGNAAALIVTAHTQPDDAAGYEVITKPVNPDRLLAQVRRVLASARPDGSALEGPAGEDAPVADLVLYVSAGSRASAQARRRMEETLRGYAGCPIRYTVRDVAVEAAGAEEDQVLFTPTLVKRGPGPRAWVLGDLADAAVVVELLKVCGVKPSA